jgi:hypothetical protein
MAPEGYERPTHPTFRAIVVVVGVTIGILLLAVISTFA